MANYPNFEKYDTLKVFIQCDENSTAASNLYFERYPERYQPDKRIFKRLQNNLIEFGTFHQARPKSYEKDNVETDTINVLARVEADPQTPVFQAGRYSKN